MKKYVEKHTELAAILFLLLLLGVSSCFGWDENPVMGWDKLCADMIITALCIAVIAYLGWNCSSWDCGLVFLIYC